MRWSQVSEYECPPRQACALRQAAVCVSGVTTYSTNMDPEAKVVLVPEP